MISVVHALSGAINSTGKKYIPFLFQGYFDQNSRKNVFFSPIDF